MEVIPLISIWKQIKEAGRRGRGITRWLIWGFVVLFSLSALLNFSSSSPWEHFGMGPLSVVFVIGCVFVALGPRTEYNDTLKDGL